LILFWIWKQIAKKDKSDKKAFIFFCLWLFVGLALHLQILPLDATVADRWFYFPIIGMLGIIGIFGKVIDVKRKGIWILSSIIIISLLCMRTFVRTFDYRDEFTLVRHDIKISQENYNLENGLAGELIKLGEYKEAEIHALASIKQNPAWNNYSNLGVIYLKLKEYEKAKTA
jgi:tetratricopeptide (TPR) repeat protein